ncbi:MAG TPA: RcnB family protein [Caulobacteraceae bacterium]|nr:RcnB family protein [Caulobacteraceae bacterium]
MKRIATAAFLVGLMSGASALAADHDHGDNGGHDQGDHHQDHQDRSSGSHGSNPNNNNNGAHTFTGHPMGTPQVGGPQTFTPRGPSSGFTPQVHHFNGPAVVNPPNPQSDWRGRGEDRNRDSGRDFGRDHEGRGQDFGRDRDRPRFNPEFFPRDVHPNFRFHWRYGRWFGPPGFYYRPWFYGEYLPFGWYESEWYINDYWDYDLPVPPYGYEWIRNGPDALLVDVSDGMVVEVVQGIFY